MKKDLGFGISRDDSVNLIVKECLRNNVTDPRQIAYILGTAQHESADFSRSREINGVSQARKLGYGGGENYYGRGYVQLTHKANYAKMDEALGLNGRLERNPELAADPKIAAKILVVGMRDGLFTGKPLSKYFDQEKCDPFEARRVVNGILKNRPETIKAAQRCMSFADKWETKLEGMLQGRTSKSPTPQRESSNVRPQPLRMDSTISKDMTNKELQTLLNALGVRDQRGKVLAVDGIVGPRTSSALKSFQQERGLPVNGVPDRATCLKLAADYDRVRGDDFRLVDTIRNKFHDVERKLGKSWDQVSENVSAALGLAAKKTGIREVDAIEFSKDLLKVAVLRGHPMGPGAVLAYVVVKEAMELPADASLRDMHQLGRFAQNVGREFGEIVIPQFKPAQAR